MWSPYATHKPEKEFQRHNRCVDVVPRRYALDLNIVLARWKFPFLCMDRERRRYAGNRKAGAVFLRGIGTIKRYRTVFGFYARNQLLYFVASHGRPCRVFVDHSVDSDPFGLPNRH